MALNPSKFGLIREPSAIFRRLEAQNTGFRPLELYGWALSDCDNALQKLFIAVLGSKLLSQKCKKF